MDFDDFLDFVTIMSDRVSTYHAMDRQKYNICIYIYIFSLIQAQICAKLSWAFQIFGMPAYLTTNIIGRCVFLRFQ